MRETSICAAIAIAAGIALAGCRRGDDAEAKPADATPIVGARTATAARRPFSETIDAIGAVASRPGHFAQLSAPSPTRVTNIFVAVGQRVSVGSPLVAFDRATFDAQAQSAEVALSTAQRAFERARRLVDAGILAKKDVDQATNDVAQARAGEVAAKRAQSLATLRSPIPGVVTRLSAVLGAAADPSQPMVEVADPSQLDILMTVAPAAAARVRRGAIVTVSAGQRGSDSASASAAGSEPLGTAAVTDVGATVDTASRGVLVRARMTRGTRPLRIGETVFGNIIVGVRRDAVVVPVEALVPEGEGFKVFVLDSAHVAHGTPVQVGARTEREAEITGGLTGGETIVTYGAYGVQDSAKVVPISTTADSAAVKPAGKKP
ncbi:MAG: efflux RND transporter periplasmic adaptor subunit [Gemmatimonadaceae bacterium]